MTNSYNEISEWNDTTSPMAANDFTLSPPDLQVVKTDSPWNRKILGINISHDASIAIVEDGKVTDVFEEERCRRVKYWAPHSGEETLYQCIEVKQLDDIDEVVFTSFDRRQYPVKVDKELSQDRMYSREFIGALESQQLSRERIEELVEKYPEFSLVTDYTDQDKIIMDDIATKQLELRTGDYRYQVAHHEHHAHCGFHLSEMDDAIIIVMDGGGCRKYWDTHPTHQEIESIYFGYIDENSQTKIIPQWQRLSNSRFISDFDEFFPNECHAAALCYKDEEIQIEGVDCVFTSRPSAGMNFSNMSAALGTDTQGRAAGKVMGMASYGKPADNIYNKFNVAQELEIDSFHHTVSIIQRAIDYAPDCKNIILSGGYALNCTNNYKYLEVFPDHQIFVDPIPHDGGTAAGAALQMHIDIQSGDFPVYGDKYSVEPYTKPSVWDEETESE